MLKIYIISIFISYLVVYISSKSIVARLKRDGVYKKPKYSFIEKIRVYLYFTIPIFNLLMSVVSIIHYEEIYKKMKKEMIEGE